MKISNLLEKLFIELKSQFNNEIFIVAIDDGSVKKPVDIDILNNQDIEGVILRLIKNVGHQQAIAIGLQYVEDKIDWAERIVVMDSDGEDNPATIPTLLNALENDSIDISVGKRKNRSEELNFKSFINYIKLPLEF